MISLILVIEEESHLKPTRQFLIDQKLVDPDRPSFNLNWYNQEEESLKIKAVRQLLEESSYQTYNNQVQVQVMLRADSASIPAQNALLKIIEEPPANTQLILTVSHPDKLLPTIRSRCLIQPCPNLSASSGNKPLSEKNLDPQTEKITTHLQNSNLPSFSQAIDWAAEFKDRQEALMLVKNLIDFLYNEKVGLPNRTAMLQSLVTAYDSLEKNANVKLTLENCFFSWRPENRA
ncbi:MAG: hypothetical protein GF381_01335 [Candidatus Pacebacteria bacterium]|nr:hypothetical protein [Candidatus Paceibacterota bacterium]